MELREFRIQNPEDGVRVCFSYLPNSGYWLLVLIISNFEFKRKESKFRMRERQTEYWKKWNDGEMEQWLLGFGKTSMIHFICFFLNFLYKP